MTPYQVKDALKRHVPQLFDDESPSLDSDQPMRFTNRAAVFSRSDGRTHSVCWEVPRLGRRTNFWISLAINPAQREWWHQLLDGEATAGQLQLVHRSQQSRWELRVPLTLPTPITAGDRDYCTPIGFDVGESILLTGCALQDGRPVHPLLIDIERARKLNQTILQRLQERNATEWRIDK